MLNRVLIDITPLRENRGFRLLFGAQLAWTLAGQLTAVAIPFQVYALTRSSLQVGLISLAQLVPLICGALVGGALGDAIDRRRLLLLTAALAGPATGLLAVNAWSAHPSLLVIYLASAVSAGLGGVISTVFNAAVPVLVGPAYLEAAYASMQVVDQVAMVAGPALAGLAIGVVHLPQVYLAAAVICLLSALAAGRLPAIPPARHATRPGAGSILAGLRYLRGRQVLQGALLIDISAMVFGAPTALFPALTASVFHGGASTLGLLYAAPAAGALAGALTTGWLAQVRHQARAVTAAICLWGAAIATLGLAHALWMAIALLAVAGWVDVISAVLRTTILQASVPEEFRSRISSVQIAAVEGGPALGRLESGAVAALTSTSFSVISGGLACIAGALLITALLPGFRRYDRQATSAWPTG